MVFFDYALDPSIRFLASILILFSSGRLFSKSSTWFTLSGVNHVAFSAHIKIFQKVTKEPGTRKLRSKHVTRILDLCSSFFFYSLDEFCVILTMFSSFIRFLGIYRYTKNSDFFINFFAENIIHNNTHKIQQKRYNIENIKHIIKNS